MNPKSTTFILFLNEACWLWDEVNKDEWVNDTKNKEPEEVCKGI